METVWNIIIFLNIDQLGTSNIFTIVVAAVAVGKLLIDDGLLQARS